MHKKGKDLLSYSYLAKPGLHVTVAFTAFSVCIQGRHLGGGLRDF